MKLRLEPWSVFCVAGGGALLLFLATPLVGLVLWTHPSEWLAGLADPAARAALGLSIFTTAVSTIFVVLLGAPLAWLLAGRRGALARAAELIVEVPIVLPPAVAGLALLLTFGRQGMIGARFDALGIEISFTTAAVVMAEIFVSAPFFIRSAVIAFRRIDPDLLLVARSLGAGPARVFFAVALPLSSSSLAAGALLSWARALGEFGATLMFAGNFPGRTQTLPLAIYAALESNLASARALAVLMVVVALIVLLLARARLASASVTAGSAPGEAR